MISLAGTVAPRPAVPRRSYYRCSDCLTPQVVDGSLPVGTTCSCGGRISYIGVVRRHRVVRLEDHAVCDARCTGATGPNCDCQCGGEHHGSGRVVTVQVADLGAVRLTPVDADAQIARATEYREAKRVLETAIMASRVAPEYVTMGAGGYVSSPHYWEVRHICERRTKAIGLKSHAGRLRALQTITEYVRKL